MIGVKTVALSVFLLAVASAGGAARTIAVLKTGSFHGGEVSFKARGEWYALVPGKRGASLRRVTASVVPEVDVIVDRGTQRTGKLVRIAPALEPIALVRGVDQLRAGAVATAVMQTPMEPGKTVEARLGERKYTFGLTCRRVERPAGASKEEFHWPGSCAVTLRSDGTRTTLFTYSAYEDDRGAGLVSDKVPEIIWAGDLDRDGRLDVLLETSDHYNESEISLYLSSSAAKGALVRRVASFNHVGC